MDVLLVQHGQAVPETVDPARPLSEEGRQAVKKLGRALLRLNLRPAQVVCTSKLRSRQTAEILMESLGLDPGLLVESDAFLPGAEPQPMINELERLYGGDPILITGHMPSLGKLAGYLLAGEARAACEFRNAGLCAIRTEGLPRAASGQVVLLLPPEVVSILAGETVTP